MPMLQCNQVWKRSQPDDANISVGHDGHRLKRSLPDDADISVGHDGQTDECLAGSAAGSLITADAGVVQPAC